MTIYRFCPIDECIKFKEGHDDCTGYIKIDIDVTAVAKAIYKDYEDTTDEYVEKVWAWESIPEDDPHNIEARDAFHQTVEEFTISAVHALEAALGEGWNND